jgi:hypothetical protein
MDKDWNHRDAPLEGRLDLQADNVVGVIQPALALIVGGGEPVRTDQY